jgi:hypothetical protein
MIETIIAGASLIVGGVGATLYARKGLRSVDTCNTLREQSQIALERSLANIEHNVNNIFESHAEMTRQVAELVGYIKGQRRQDL